MSPPFSPVSPSRLVFIYFAFNMPLLFFLFISVSVASFYSHPLCHFLSLCLGPFLFFCFTVTSPHCSTFLFVIFFIGSCRFTHHHRHAHRDPLSLNSKGECDFQNLQKKATCIEYSPRIILLEITLAHQQLKAGTSSHLRIHQVSFRWSI